MALTELGRVTGHVNHHCGLTARKIDLTPRYGCPGRDEWYRRINNAMHGTPTSAVNLVGDGMLIIFGPSGAALVSGGYWCNLDGEGYDYWSKVPGMVVQSVGQREWDVMHAGATHGQSADDPLT